MAAAALLCGCARPPLTVVAQSDDQISVCRETDLAEFQEAENIAADYCGDRRLLPKLASTDRCRAHAVRYNYICTARHY